MGVDPRPLRRSPQLRPTPNLSRSNSHELSGSASQGTAMDPGFSDNLITALTETLEEHERQTVYAGSGLKIALIRDAMPQTPPQSGCRTFEALLKHALWGCCAENTVA